MAIDQRQEDVQLASYVNSRRQQMQGYRGTKEKAWLQAFKDYRAVADVLSDKDDWMSNFFIPLVPGLADDAQSRMAADYINDPGKRLVSLLARKPEFLEKARKNSQFLQYKFDRSRFVTQFLQTLFSCVQYGTGVGKVVQVEEKRKMRVRRQVGVETNIGGVPIKLKLPGAFVEREEEVVTYKGPRYFDRDIGCIWFDERARSFEEAYDLIDGDLYTYDQVKTMMKDKDFRKYNLDEIPPATDLNTFRVSRFGTSGQTQRQQTWQADIGELSKKGKLYWVDDYRTDDRQVVVLNSRYVLCDRSNTDSHGRKPLTVITFFPLIGEIYGMGIPEKLSDMQGEINAVHNLRIDAWELAIHRMFLVDLDRIDDPERDLVVAPNKFIKVRAGGSLGNIIAPVPIPDISSSAYREEDSLRYWAEFATGITPYARGEETPGGTDTATGINILASQALSRLGFHGRMIAIKGLLPAAEMYWSLIQQYQDGKEFFRITDTDFEAVDIEDVLGEYDFKVEIDPLGAKGEVQRQQLMAFLNVVGKFLNPQTGTIPATIASLVKEIGNKFDIPDIDNIVKLLVEGAPVPQQFAIPGGLNGQQAAAVGGGQIGASQPAPGNVGALPGMGAGPPALAGAGNGTLQGHSAQGGP